MEGWSKKGKGLMDMDNSVMIAGGGGYKDTKMVMEKKYQKSKKKNKVMSYTHKKISVVTIPKFHYI